MNQKSAGEFSTWLDNMIAAMKGDADADVPCGDCTGCCTSSQFVHIEPDEAATLAAIPKTLLFPAPGMPPGHQLMGYNDLGNCPMLIDNACSIYSARPRTCRTYDCRIFPAAGLEIDAATKRAIAERVGQWEFEHSTERSVERHAAVKRGATFLAHRRKELPAGSVPTNTTQLAGMAIALHELFEHASEPTVESVAIEITRRRL